LPNGNGGGNAKGTESRTRARVLDRDRSVDWDFGLAGVICAYRQQKRHREEAANKAGHKTEECKTLWQRTTSDPVAFFTFWLVVSTVGLGVSTVLLWRAGEKQLRHARRSVAIQSRDMRASIEMSTSAAKAAEDSVLISRQIGESQVRAYLSCEGATYTITDSYLACEARIRNHGQSPAIGTEIKAVAVTQTVGNRTDGTTGIKYVTSKKTGGGGPAIAAGQVATIFIIFLHGDMGEGAHESIWSADRRFEIRGRVDWSDVFGDAPVSKGERRGEMTSFNRASEHRTQQDTGGRAT
jgi:hypothetical protein